MAAQTFDAFQVIADPSRRQMLQLLSKESLTINGLAENFDMSRPAVSKHIKILTECGLIMIKQEGRHRYCEARLDKLNEVSDWVEQYRKFWTQKLDVLEIYLDDLQKVESKKNKKRTINKRKK